MVKPIEITIMTTAKPTINHLDQVIVRGLKSEDSTIKATFTQRFFYEDIAGLINTIKWSLFRNTIEYDELVSELYLHLSKNGWQILNSYRGEEKLSTWLNCVAWRYFFKLYKRNKRMQPTDDVQSLVNEVVASISDDDIRMDVESVLAKMSNKTYVEALRLNVVHGYSAEESARLMNTTISNFYNIKSRAIKTFLSIYGKRYVG